MLTRTCHKLSINVIAAVDRDSSVGIATRYGMDDRGSNSGVGEIFRTRPDRPWGPPSLPYNGYWVPFPGIKRQDVTLATHPHLAPRLKQ
jgi:hypothetical protein